MKEDKKKKKELLDVYINGTLMGYLDQTNGCLQLRRGYMDEYIHIPSAATMSSSEITSVIGRLSQNIEVILDRIREFNKNIEIFENIIEFKISEIIPGARIIMTRKYLEYVNCITGRIYYIITEEVFPSISSSQALTLSSYYSFSLDMDKLNDLINNGLKTDGPMDDYIDIVCLSILKSRNAVRERG